MLRRVSKSGQSTVPNQGDGVLSINSKSVASNVYSPNELLLLSWLNEHYQSMRQTFCGAGRSQTPHTFTQVSLFFSRLCDDVFISFVNIFTTMFMNSQLCFYASVSVNIVTCILNLIYITIIIYFYLIYIVIM